MYKYCKFKKLCCLLKKRIFYNLKECFYSILTKSVIYTKQDE